MKGTAVRYIQCGQVYNREQAMVGCPRCKNLHFDPVMAFVELPPGKAAVIPFSVLMTKFPIVAGIQITSDN